jgi:hypothetical protein
LVESGQFLTSASVGITTGTVHVHHISDDVRSGEVSVGLAPMLRTALRFDFVALGSSVVKVVFITEEFVLTV